MLKTDIIQVFSQMDAKTLISIMSAVLAATALSVTLYDRRPRLVVRARRGHWCALKPTVDRREVVFTGLVEVYNVSSRANTIRGYAFFRKKDDGSLEEMDAEWYRVSGKDEEEIVHNVTPFALPPYSGSEVRVMGIFKGQPEPEILVVVELEDLFGKKHQAEVKARYR